MTALTNRIEFVLLFDVTNGNPNGDPDMGNMPRVDPETRLGLVTDVCLKRKLRNYVEAVKGAGQGAKTGYEIYVRERAILNDQHQRAYDAHPEIVHLPRRLPKKEDEARTVTKWMCDTFFDIRAFGAVMSTDVNVGQVRGPVQLAFARSIDPVQPLNITITRMAVTTEREAREQSGDNRTMGDKWIVPYGLYRAHGFVSAHLAQRTGFSEEDFGLLCRGLKEMFDHDRSASRGEMACRALYVFRHENPLGNAPAQRLFERITVAKKGTIPKDQPPRAFADYDVKVKRDSLPAGVTLEASGQ
jgi:CRISPR-associated protein Csd2